MQNALEIAGMSLAKKLRKQDCVDKIGSNRFRRD
jgi:hypothetical protein